MPAQRKFSRDELLDTAAHLFAERGYTDTSIDDLLAELNITRPTLYMHIRSKRELIDAIHERLHSIYRSELPRYVQTDAPPLLRIRGLLALQLDMTLKARDSLVLLARHREDLGERFPELHLWWKETDEILLIAIIEGQTRGELSQQIDPVVLKHAFWAIFNNIPHWFHEGRLSTAQVADQLTLLFSTKGHEPG